VRIDNVRRTDVSVGNAGHGERAKQYYSGS
jgi:hypothetical protein